VARTLRRAAIKARHEELHRRWLADNFMFIDRRTYKIVFRRDIDEGYEINGSDMLYPLEFKKICDSYFQNYEYDNSSPPFIGRAD
jgi:hypothetical protein